MAESNVEPRPIKRLNETLINRIAAGEIIHRPASALKELIENCLDAGSTSIKITVKDGGLKLLQIQDNGHGIRKADLPILAERFTTSKLSSFSDLSRIATYGFRGEALASMSHVAKLSVTTKTKKDGHAWKATYSDGMLVPAKPGQTADPKPSAGNDGTIITIEDLFYNTPTRLSALRSSSEEYARILDVVTKYAIHNSKVSFQCKKAGSASPEVTTPPNATIPQAIKLLYGHTIANDLLHVAVGPSATTSEVEPDDSMDVDEDEDDDGPSAEDNVKSGPWKAEVHFTNANYQAKKTNFLLFINHRLVESSRMKRAVEAVYVSILPKGASPFVYLSLHVHPKNLDVNVHPTKREVHFLDEDTITERICSAMQATLAKQATSRTFETQTLLTKHLNPISTPRILTSAKGKERATDADGDEEMNEDVQETQVTQASTSRQKVYPHYKVRTNLTDRTLDSMFPVANPSQLGVGGGGAQMQKTRSQPQTQAQTQSQSSSEVTGGSEGKRTREIKESECYLTSVKSLRKEVGKAKHRQLTEIFEKHTFVGIVDLEKCLSIIQHSTNLYVVNHASVAEELFYQLGLRQFGDMSRLKLEPPPQLRELLEIAVDAEDTSSTKLSKDQIVESYSHETVSIQKIHDLLVTRREMLTEYFSFDISEDGRVLSLPLLLRDYIPNLDNLPSFLMRLGPQVNWTSETECFGTFLRELAYFYAPLTFPSDTSDSSVGDNDKDKEKGADEDKANAAEKWQIQHVLFPAMRRYLVPPKSLVDKDVVQVASLPDLYKVFERC
ncbi:hypothetical protein EST38_g8206 [Candolleomyces aberdarensis]|uniref:DNA mismatch repair protein S5 domain-containing protein n=1 Tax=Candolleomyces aberdarensis TaxID=2316362 RepID=A0A4Q2DD88_9AGAR|nr:hypothetical protein EST38_g8206 [Candolleomyces aberdarensis]